MAKLKRSEVGLLSRMCLHMQYIASGVFSNMTPSNRRHLAKLKRAAAYAIYDKTKFLSALLPYCYITSICTAEKCCGSVML